MLKKFIHNIKNNDHECSDIDLDLTNTLSVDDTTSVTEKQDEIVMNELSKALLSGNIGPDSKILIDLKDGELHFVNVDPITTE